MNEELIKLRGKYEILNDELRNLNSQIVTEAEAISKWANLFLYCDRTMNEKILVDTRQDVEQYDLIINRISRLKNHHIQANEILRQIQELRPLVKK